MEKAFNDLPMLPPPRSEVETLEVLRQISATALAIGELNGSVKMLPNLLILLNAIILKEATASSEIENIITTQDKLYQALSSRVQETDSATKEVLRYRSALLEGLHLISERGFLNTNTIIRIQQILEENSAGVRKLPGTALKNAVTGQTVYTPPDDHDTILRLLKNLEDYINNDDDISPFIKLAVQHYQFESIHPFYDGNGRTGRIINVLFLILKGLLDKPVIYPSRFITNNKQDYYRLLQEVRTRGNWEKWVIYINQGIEISAKETMMKIHEINSLIRLISEQVKRDYPKIYSKELIEVLFVQPYCRIDSVMEQLGVSRPTASRYLNTLSGCGILSARQLWKETLFVNQQLFELLRD